MSKDSHCDLNSGSKFRSRLRDVFLVAYHFPPIQSSSGVHRALAFARYLPELGWMPTVFTVHRRAYPNTEEINETLIPEGIDVIRSFALDSQRHLAVRGRYLTSLAVPDRWASWIPFGVRAAMRHARRAQPAIIMSTFPIPSAHIIARAVHRKTGIPWIADLRDPMVFDTYPAPGPVRRAYERLERSVFDEATRVLVTTQGAQAMYAARYPNVGEKKLRVLENGFDESIFRELDTSSPGTRKNERLKLVHSGVIYPDARDPRPLFSALSKLKSEGRASATQLEVVFRASGQEKFLRRLSNRLGVSDLVTILPPINYRDALREMLDADALLLLQARNCNDQIPAKAYEYLFCGKPILALTDPSGDTGMLLRNHGASPVCALEDEVATESTLRGFLESLQQGTAKCPDAESVRSLSRRARTHKLAQILEEVDKR